LLTVNAAAGSVKVSIIATVSRITVNFFMAGLLLWIRIRISICEKVSRTPSLP
jgi:hypothetical protein